MTYFKNANTLEELRRQYKELLKKHHPDNGGNVADMQEINVEYDRLFRLLKDKHESHSEDSTEKQSDFDRMKYDFTEDQKLRDVLNKIIGLDGIVIEIAGAWIWISGNTFAHKKEMKELGFKWASQKKNVVLAFGRVQKKEPQNPEHGRHTQLLWKHQGRDRRNKETEAGVTASKK